MVLKNISEEGKAFCSQPYDLIFLYTSGFSFLFCVISLRLNLDYNKKVLNYFFLLQPISTSTIGKLMMMMTSQKRDQLIEEVVIYWITRFLYSKWNLSAMKVLRLRGNFKIFSFNKTKSVYKKFFLKI